MSQRINFLEEQGEGLTYQQLALIAFGILILVFSFWGVEKLRLNLAQNKLITLQSEIEKIKNTQGIKPQEKEDINPIETVFQSMVKEPQWPEVLRVISRSVDRSIWLEKIHGETTAEGGQISLEGIAYQARRVPGFLDRLRSYDVFSRIDLISSETNGKDIDAPLHFKVLAKTKKR